ncbi:hypothetical protein H4R24_000538 [Coemansia sp. RSA 988]|nr:hypothetical protein H4R24_000538 [Coemansia sp. RSA 988]
MELHSIFSQTLCCKAANASAEARYSDKIYLPQSFLASLLDLQSNPPRPGASGMRGRAMMASMRQNSYAASSDGIYDNDGHGNDDKRHLPSPMIFRIKRRKTALSDTNQNTDHGVAFCGVREFSCEEGEVAIPEWIMQNAGLIEGDSVSVEFVRPEKGTFAVLQAHDVETQSVGDLRALLESHMRTRLTVLSLGLTVEVPVGGMSKPLSFSVAALEPMDAVDIVDTDLSVDIVHVDGDVISDRPKDDAGQQQPDELIPDVMREVTITKDRPRVFQLHIPADADNAEILVVCQPGSDASLCASRIQRNPGILDNEWFDYSLPSQQSKTLHIKCAQLPSGSNTIYASVVGSTDTCIATIEARLDAPTKPEQTNVSVPETKDNLEIEERMCTNCGSSVPNARFEMHRAVCERHNVKCSSCSRIFKRGSAELDQHWHCDICNEAGEKSDSSKHMYFYHTPRACSCDPSQSYPSLIALADHRRTHCDNRLIDCQYCHIIVAQGPISSAAEAIMLGQRAHEYECGSRSITCVKCKTYVRIRQVQVHMRVHEMKDAEARANMVPCTNKECRRERGDNLLGLCSICFGPLYSGQYDPGNHKLLKRLARNLHMQLTNGCGSVSCHNMHCASGRANAISDANATPLSQTEAAAMLVPILKAYSPLATGTTVDYSGIDLHLCV